MIKLEKEKMNIIKHLFRKIRFNMATSAIQGYMGEVYVNKLESPDFAMIFLGRFCFIDGNPNNEDAESALKNIDNYYKIIIANDNWFNLIEKVYKNNYEIDLRYSMKKDTNFDKERLVKLSKTLDNHYEIKPIEGKIYQKVLETDSFSTNISMSENYEKYGFGYCAIEKSSDKIVAVITTQAVYDNSREMNIKIEEEHRRKGIGTAISAIMILECLNRNIYPSWDAANLNSLRLSEKLGYELDSEYRIYEINRKKQIAKDK